MYLWNFYGNTILSPNVTSCIRLWIPQTETVCIYCAQYFGLYSRLFPYKEVDF